MVTKSANCLIHWKTSNDSIVLTKDIEIYEFCRLMVTNETSDDPVDLTKDTGVMQGLPIDGDQRKAEKNDQTELTNN